MLLLPIAARELLIQGRRRSTYWIRVAAAAVAGVLMLWNLLVNASSAAPASGGRILFFHLSVLAFSYSLFVGALATADSIGAEKRQGTIGLLFLTDLKGYDVILGKLVSSSVHCVYGLLAVVPMISISLFFGGVTAGEVARTVLVLGNTLFFSLSAGMLVSTLSRHERQAVFAALLLVFLISAGPYGLGYLLANKFPTWTVFRATDMVLWPSPVFAFKFAQSATGARPIADFYSSLALTHAIAWVLLALACLIVPRVCVERPPGRRQAHWNARWRRWILGEEGVRAAFRRRLLDLNPCFWLSSRERRNASVVWLLVLGLAAMGLWTWLVYRTVFFEASLFLVMTLHVMLKIWIAGETCRRWIEDRQCGALELLLCAPVTTQELLRGQGMALRRQFGWPWVATLGLTLTVWILLTRSGANDTPLHFWRGWLLASMPVLVADGMALRWIGAWMGLTALGLNRAIAGTIARVLWLRWILFLGCVVGAGVWAWIRSGQPELLPKPAFWLVSALTLDVILSWLARKKLLRWLRVIAASPMDYRSAIRKTVVNPALFADQAKPRRSRQKGAMRSQRPVKLAAWIVTLGLLVGIPLGNRLWIRRQVTQRLQAAQQAGLLVPTEELARRRPPLSNEVNAAEILEKASPNLLSWHRLSAPVLQNLPGMSASAAYPNCREPLPESMKSGLYSAVSSNQNGLAIIHAAPSLRSGRYATDWKSSGGGKYSVQFTALHTASQLLLYEVFLDAEDGDFAGALDSVHRLFDLSHSLDFEPGFILHWQRTACFSRAVRALEWCLTRCPVPETELQAIQKELIEAEDKTDMQLAVVQLRYRILVEYPDELSSFYRSPPASTVFGRPGPPGDLERFRLQLQGRIDDLTGAKDRGVIAFLDRMDEFTRIVQAPLPERLYRARSLEDKYPAAYPGDNSLHSPSAFRNEISRQAEFVARCRTAVTGLTIEQYRLQHAGRLPETLDLLVPEFLRVVPPDPFDGQPLRYQQLSPGYCIYSVGENGRDDGGASASDLSFSVGR